MKVLKFFIYGLLILGCLLGGIVACGELGEENLDAEEMKAEISSIVDQADDIVSGVIDNLGNADVEQAEKQLRWLWDDAQKLEERATRKTGLDPVMQETKNTIGAAVSIMQKLGETVVATPNEALQMISDSVSVYNAAKLNLADAMAAYKD